MYDIFIIENSVKHLNRKTVLAFCENIRKGYQDIAIILYVIYYTIYTTILYYIVLSNVL